MCCTRTVFWDEPGKEILRKNAGRPAGSMVCENREKSQDAPKSRSLPPFLEDVLDFLKGFYGIKPSTT